MTTDAGDLLTPPRLNPVAFQLQLASNYTVTLTPTALTLTNVTPGYSGTSYTVPDGGMTGLAVWQGDFQLTASGAINLATLALLIDGAVPANSPAAIFDPGNVTDARMTAFASWPFTLAAGSHSFGLSAAVSPSVTNVRLNASHTALSILLHP